MAVDTDFEMNVEAMQAASEEEAESRAINMIEAQPEAEALALLWQVVRKRWPDARLWRGDPESDVFCVSGPDRHTHKLGGGATELLAVRAAAEAVIAEAGYVFQRGTITSWWWNCGKRHAKTSVATRDLAFFAACRDYVRQATAESPIPALTPSEAFDTTMPCPRCGGTGWRVPGESQRSSFCRPGTWVTIPCDMCRGSRRIAKQVDDIIVALRDAEARADGNTASERLAALLSAASYLEQRGQHFLGHYGTSNLEEKARAAGWPGWPLARAEQQRAVAVDVIYQVEGTVDGGQVWQWPRIELTPTEAESGQSRLLKFLQDAYGHLEHSADNIRVRTRIYTTPKETAHGN